jgi:hypothetical protein
MNGHRSWVPAITAAVCVTVIILALVAVYAWQTSRGVDATGTLPILIAVVGSAVPGLVSLFRTEKVVEQTNGNTSRLLSIIEQRLPPEAGDDGAPGEASPPTGKQHP